MEFISNLFGLHTDKLLLHQMIVRAITVFFIALAFIRISGIRTLGKQTAFDNLTSIILGAILGRAIVSAQQPFFPSLLAVLVLMLLHRFVSLLTFKSHRLGKIFKGESIPLIEDGKFIEKNMSRTNTTKEDIEESLHLFLTSDEMKDIKAAYLERSGEISIIRNNKEEK